MARPSTGSFRRLPLLAVTLAIAAIPAPAALGGDAPGIVVRDGVTQPVPALAATVQQRVFVETPVDTDGDGRLDRVALDVSRPRATVTGDLDVPVIFEHSPYRKDFWLGAPLYDVLVDELPQAGPRGRPDLPGELDDFYVPRGYGVVLGHSVGTGDSDGCPTIGDEAETLSGKAVVDWLNGRARAWDAAGRPAAADWTTGSVGMIGVSYDGTLASQVAATGVEGLDAAIPISAISRWYDYYRSSGLVVAPLGFQGEDTDNLAQFTTGETRARGKCAEEIARLAEGQDRTTGDVNGFWHERDHLRLASRVRASVLLVHGLNDWNVKTQQFAQWWERLRTPSKLWLHGGAHGPPDPSDAYTLPDGRARTYQETEHRWLDRWLWGVDNGVGEDAKVIIQRAAGGAYTVHEQWPDPEAEDVRLWLGARSAIGPGTLGPRRPPSADRALQGFVDAGRTMPADALAANPDAAEPNRLVFRAPPLEHAVRLSGTPRVRLRLSVDNRTAANLSAALVDYGAAGHTIVTRGWADAQNRASAAEGEPVRPGRTRTHRWELQPKDHVFEAGHRIGLVVYSTDREYTLLPRPGARLTITPSGSRLSLPVVGGDDGPLDADDDG